MALHFIFLENMSAPKGADVSALPKSVTIVGDEAHHAIRVKRLAAGDSVRLANGHGATATARIERTMKSSAGFEILTLIEPPGWTLAPQPSVPIEVFASPPKGDRLSTMVDMLGQIGVARYTPLLTERTEVSANDHKRQRLERVAVETLKQCGRPWLLEIGEPLSFADALTSDTERWKTFCLAMFQQGVYLAPSPFEAAFWSSAHHAAEIRHTLAAAEVALSK